MTILPEEEAIPPRGPGRPSKYPWNEWFKHGQTVRINRGQHYDIPTENMRIQVNKAARRPSGRVATRAGLRGEYLQFTFYLVDDLRTCT